MSLRTRLSLTALETRENPSTIDLITAVYTPPVTPPAGTVVDVGATVPAAPATPPAPPIYTPPGL